MASSPADPGGAMLPLIVDMDGCLLRTDILFEGLAALATRAPLKLCFALTELARGRPALKRRVAALAAVDVATLPVRADLLDYLRAQKARGRRIELVSAADRAEAERVAARVGVFDSVHASEGAVNLKGARKAAFLTARYPGGFVYAGDSPADLAVWRAAAGIILAGAEPATAAAAAKLGKPIVATFPDPPAGAAAWSTLLKPAGLAIYLVAILPWFLAMFGAPAWEKLGLIVLALCAADAAGALFVRLRHAQSDRANPTAAGRPIASGAVPVHEAMLAAAACASIATLAAAWVDWRAVGVVAAVAALRAIELAAPRQTSWASRAGLGVCALMAGALAL